MNNFFDCCNVRSYNEGIHTRNAFLAPYKSQDDTSFTWLLNTFLQYFHSWKNSISTRPGQFTATARAKMFISQQTMKDFKSQPNHQ